MEKKKCIWKGLILGRKCRGFLATPVELAGVPPPNSFLDSSNNPPQEAGGKAVLPRDQEGLCGPPVLRRSWSATGKSGKKPPLSSVACLAPLCGSRQRGRQGSRLRAGYITIYIHRYIHTRLRTCYREFSAAARLFPGSGARDRRERRRHPPALAANRPAGGQGSPRAGRISPAPLASRPAASLTVPALVLAEAVLAAQEVQGRVEVHVDLVHPVADGLQRHPPVGGLRRLLAARRPRAQPGAGQQQQQQQQGAGHAERRPLSRLRRLSAPAAPRQPYPARRRHRPRSCRHRPHPPVRLGGAFCRSAAESAGPRLCPPTATILREWVVFPAWGLLL